MAVVEVEAELLLLACVEVVVAVDMHPVASVPAKARPHKTQALFFIFMVANSFYCLFCCIVAHSCCTNAGHAQMHIKAFCFC